MRESRNKIKKNPEDLLKPINIFELGTENDPCFGKLYDLKAQECNNCGDADFCAVVMAQNMHIKRNAVEGRFKDTEEAEYVMGEKQKQAVKYMGQLKKDGVPNTLIQIRARKKFNLSKEFTRDLFNAKIK